MKEHLPANLKVVWGRGSKSFVEVLRNSKAQIIYDEAPEGQQLPDKTFRNIFFIALGLAKREVQNTIQYTRYDQEEIVPEDENNRAFSQEESVGGVMKKTIHIEGHIYRSEL